ncbi:MAG: hypothetical protein PHY12_05385 [Eubacteriales bacterium]|nr:hypothetical protein [Eubacteriales bacterium]
MQRQTLFPATIESVPRPSDREIYRKPVNTRCHERPEHGGEA